MTAITKFELLGSGLLSVFVCSCGPAEPLGTPGALKEGGFTYCETTTGPCGQGTVPDHLAVGSTFVIGFDPGSGANGTIALESSDSLRLERLTSDGSGILSFRALASGPVQVEARTTASDELIDFVRLDLQDIDSLPVRLCPRAFNAITSPGATFDHSGCGGDPAGTSSVDISQGSSLAPTVCAFPVGATGDDLQGHLIFDWATNGGATAELELFVGEDGRCATIGGLTTGAASMTVSTEKISSVLAVTVKP